MTFTNFQEFCLLFTDFLLNKHSTNDTNPTSIFNNSLFFKFLVDFMKRNIGKTIF